MAKFFRPTIFSKGLILIAIPLLFELTFGLTMFGLQKYYREVIAQETKAKAIIYHANELWLNTVDACVEKIENSLFGVVHDQLQEEENIQKECEILKTLVENDTARMRQLKKLKRICEMLVKTGGSFEKQTPPSEAEMGGMAALRGRFSSFKDLQHQLKAFGKLIRAFREPDELKSRDAETRVARIQSVIDYVIVGAVVFSVCMNAVLLIYFMKGINRGILGLLENTKRMARSEPLLPELSSDDEFGHLDRSFHQMARAVESATRRERATISNAGDMICVLDENSKIVSVNPAATRKLGYTSEAVKERGLERLVLDNDFGIVKSSMQNLQEGKNTETFECRMLAENGDVVWTSWNVQWSKDDNEFFCVAHDITEQKRMEQMKQEFFGMISHDMRTPLTAILTAVDSLLAGVAGEVSERVIMYLKLAEQGGQYLLNLMQDLLDIERLSAGAFPLNIEEFDFADVFKQAADMVSPLAAKAGLKVTIPEGHYECSGDRDALTRVLVNLISNAIKFSPSGSSIDLAFVEAKENYTIEVRDHGRGIPEELQSKVFDRFKQVNLDDAKKKGGSGLGLAICKGFVEAHGGTIGVRSKSGEGSTFWFLIPKSEASSA